MNGMHVHESQKGVMVGVHIGFRGAFFGVACRNDFAIQLYHSHFRIFRPDAFAKIIIADRIRLQRVVVGALGRYDALLAGFQGG